MVHAVVVRLVTRTRGALLEMVAGEGVTVLSHTPTAYGQLLGEEEDWARWWGEVEWSCWCWEERRCRVR